MFKSVSIVALFLFSTQAFGETSSSCPGENGYYFTNYKHRNPTRGGFISNKADVQDTDDMIFIGPDVSICGSSRVSGRARIFGDAVIRNATVKDRAEISEKAVIANGAEVSGNARISGNAAVSGFVEVTDDTIVTDNAAVVNLNSERLTRVMGKARVGGNARVTDDALVEGSARINGNAQLSGDVRVDGTAMVKGHTKRSSGQISSGILEDPDYEGMERARKEKIAADERNRKAEEQRIRDQRWAEAEARKEAKRIEDAKNAVILEYRNELYGMFVQNNFNVNFRADHCFVEVSEPGDSKVISFDFTRNSNAILNGISRARYFKYYHENGDRAEFTLDSERIGKAWTVVTLKGPHEKMVKYKNAYDALFEHCQK